MLLTHSHFELLSIACILLVLHFDRGETQPKVSVSVPVKSVKEGGIFSIHCQIWNLDLSGHEVEIVRTFDSSSQRLSVDTDIHAKADDRFYLAVRTLTDSSIVYFMSLVDVTRADEADYACKIISVYPTLMEVASDSKPLRVTYYPASPEPRCEQAGANVQVTEGSAVSFECSAESAYPQITLYWTRAGKLLNRRNNGIVHSEVRHGRTYSTITITPSAGDEGAMLFCHIESSAFPGRDQYCHVGPLSVKLDESIIRTSSSKVVEFPARGNSDSNSVNPLTDSVINTPVLGSGNGLQCHSTCPGFYQSNAFYWVISTAATGIFAFVFLIIIIVLGVQYYYQKHDDSMYMRTSEQEKHRYGVVEDIYTSLERNVEHGKMYMMLSKSSHPLELCSPEET